MMSNDKIESASPHVLPPLPYAENALDPVIPQKRWAFTTASITGDMSIT